MRVMSPKAADRIENSLIWVYPLCPDLPVQKPKICLDIKTYFFGFCFLVGGRAFNILAKSPNLFMSEVFTVFVNIENGA